KKATNIQEDDVNTRPGSRKKKGKNVEAVDKKSTGSSPSGSTTRKRRGKPRSGRNTAVIKMDSYSSEEGVDIRGTVDRRETSGAGDREGGERDGSRSSSSSSRGGGSSSSSSSSDENKSSAGDVSRSDDSFSSDDMAEDLPDLLKLQSYNPQLVQHGDDTAKNQRHQIWRKTRIGLGATPPSSCGSSAFGGSNADRGLRELAFLADIQGESHKRVCGLREPTASMVAWMRRRGYIY
ncbi:unnamed protein product, partial [Amoebophrya sp. A25]